jgi:peptidoglycan/xylan/chitin deacetylase (PgdA/CDA1 family)
MGIMTATDVIHQLQTLPPDEVAKVRDWLSEHDDESPELLAAVDEGLRSLAEKGARVVTRGELEQKVRQWAGRSQ